MNNTGTCLSLERMRALLDGEISSDEQAIAEEHFGNCPQCREMAERVLNLPDWWDDAFQVLQDTIPSPDALQAEALRLLGPTDDPRMLGRIGNYEIVGILGVGGMGAVFKAFDGTLNRYVAIKMLRPNLATSSAARLRFAREAKAAAAVVHEHVMAIHNVAEWRGQPYFVMPYSRGSTLQHRIATQGSLELCEILRIAMQTARGLAAAHAQGIVHRDVKPSNILLDDGVERVSLTDFGLARAVDDASLTQSGMLAGTPQYMSPEQARGEAVDCRSDLFSLGCVLYTMCTGRPPFLVESSYATLRLIIDSEPMGLREYNPAIPPWFCKIVARLMAKDPDQRYQSARQVADLLEQCLAHAQQPENELPAGLMEEPVLSSPTRSAFLRFPFKKGIAAMVATTCVVLLTLLYGQSPKVPPIPDLAGFWFDEQTGEVCLLEVNDGEYAGSCVTFLGLTEGTFQVKWSADERRFTGTWKEGDKRFGKISLRPVNDSEIRGAYTIDPESHSSAHNPRLSDIYWQRMDRTGKQQYVVRPSPESEQRRQTFLRLGDFDYSRNLNKDRIYQMVGEPTLFEPGPNKEHADLARWTEIFHTPSSSSPYQLTFSFGSDGAVCAGGLFVNGRTFEQIGKETVAGNERTEEVKTKVSFEQLAGTYVAKHTEGEVQVKLEGDGTFQYSVRSPQMYQEFRGVWRLQNNQIHAAFAFQGIIGKLIISYLKPSVLQFDKCELHKVED